MRNISLHSFHFLAHQDQIICHKLDRPRQSILTQSKTCNYCFHFCCPEIDFDPFRSSRLAFQFMIPWISFFDAILTIKVAVTCKLLTFWKLEQILKREVARRLRLTVSFSDHKVLLRRISLAQI
jgi:hypothetical protein